MAQLKDTVVSGNLRIIDTLFTNTIQLTVLRLGGSLGNAGQVVKSNGDSSAASWATITPADIGALATSQGASNANKFIIINSSGTAVPTTP